MGRPARHVKVPKQLIIDNFDLDSDDVDANDEDKDDRKRDSNEIDTDEILTPKKVKHNDSDDISSANRTPIAKESIDFGLNDGSKSPLDALFFSSNHREENTDEVSTPKIVKHTDDSNDISSENRPPIGKELLEPGLKDAPKSPLDALLLSSDHLSDIEREKLILYLSPPPAVATAAAALANDTYKSDNEKDNPSYLEVLSDKVIDVSNKVRSKNMNFYCKESKEDKARSKKEEQYTVVKYNTAFCCALCDCRPEYRKQLWDKKSRGFVQTCNNSLYHRRCCHRAIKFSTRWKSPLEKAIYRAMPTEDNLHLLDEIQSEIVPATFKEIFVKYNQSKKDESEMYNMDGCVGEDSRLNMNDDYVTNRKNFYQLTKKQETTKRSIVVLNLFGGIGSAIVVLKRLGISIQKIIHVEHDLVATHVFRWNHDPNYLQEVTNDRKNLRNDNFQTEFEYFETFEDFSKESRERTDLKIDLVIASPNASDFSGINTRRQGVEGREGLYMLEVGKLIQQIQKQQADPILFLASNTFIQTQKMKPIDDCDRQQIEKGFGISWSWNFDASDVSPCRRRSTFFSNIPYQFVQIEKGYNLAMSDSLENDFMSSTRLVENVLLNKGQLTEESMTIDKCRTFTISLSSIDDDRMRVYKRICPTDTTEKGKKYVSRVLRISEREKLMGLPADYVSKPVQHLFETLQYQGFGDGIRCDKKNQPDMYWHKQLPIEYFKFSGNYHRFREDLRHKAHQFTSRVGEEISLMLAPPQTTQELVHYTKERYAKRLIGNAYSIPVLEELLKPICGLYRKEEYDDYKYPYAW